MNNKEQRANNTVIWLVIMLVVLIIIAIGITLLNGEDDEAVGINASTTQSVTEATTEEAVTTAVTTTIAVEKVLDINDYDIYSENALLMDMDGNVLYSKNGDETAYPASLTKIMTVIVALENISDLDNDVTIPGDIFDYIAAEGASTAGFIAYENVTYRDLVYGALLESGAECCLTLASYLGGSEEMFVRMMNEKAEELGLENTNFTNVCGLHSYEHYSTAEDIAKVLSYALENADFRKAFTSSSYYTETDMNPYGITFNSTMFSALDSSEFYGGYFLGGKTGFTDEAGLCLASLAEVGGKEFILVTTGADGTHYTEPYHIYDAETIYESLYVSDICGGQPEDEYNTQNYDTDEDYSNDENYYDDYESYEYYNYYDEY